MTNVRTSVAIALEQNNMAYTTRVHPRTGRIEVRFDGNIIRNDFISFDEAEAYAKKMNSSFIHTVVSTLKSSIERRYASRF